MKRFGQMASVVGLAIGYALIAAFALKGFVDWMAGK